MCTLKGSRDEAVEIQLPTASAGTVGMEMSITFGFLLSAFGTSSLGWFGLWILGRHVDDHSIHRWQVHAHDLKDTLW